MSKLGLWGLKKSPWVYHLAAAPCNNCDIEILELLTPRYDVERFGVVLVGSPRHADALLVTGVINRKSLPRVLEVYEQAAKPCLVICVGSCTCDKHIFRNSYNAVGPYDKHFPVHAYIPGCPPKPEAMLLGVVKALSKL
ncbi:MAG: NADH-quinone oxidoreductase subunit NuoB [bacterium]